MKVTPNMTFDSSNRLNGEIRKRSLTVKEDSNQIDLGLAVELQTSSSTAQLCPTYEYNENRVVFGNDNQGFEAINLDKSDNTNIGLTEVSERAKWYKSLKGLILTVMSALFFALSTVIVKHLKDVDAEQKAFFRFFGILVFTIPLVMDNSLNPFGPKSTKRWMILRGICGATSIFFRYSALHYISLSNVTIIVLSMPVFVFIFAKIFLNEPFGWFHVFALIITLIGVTFTPKLAIIFTQTSETIKEFGIDSRKEIIGLSFSLGAALVGSAAYVIVRKIKEVKHSIILFNFSWVAITETSILTFCLSNFKFPNNMSAVNANAWMLFLLGIFSFYGQLLLTKALQVEEAGLVSITRASSEVIYSFVFQIFIFNDMPQMWSYIGAALVMVSVLMTSFRKWLLGLPKDSNIRIKFNFMTK